MLTKMQGRPRGRPTEGTEKKMVSRGARIEKTLDDEFVFACQILGISHSDGVRQGIILFIKEFAKHYR